MKYAYLKCIVNTIECENTEGESDKILRFDNKFNV